MLVLSRRRSEQIVIDGSIRITVVKLERGTVRLGIEAPADVRIVRQELIAADDVSGSARVESARDCASERQ
jgi:carbon storage regulator